MSWGLSLGTRAPPQTPTRPLFSVPGTSLGRPRLGTGQLPGPSASSRPPPYDCYFYPLGVALRTQLIRPDICQVGQEGAAWQRRQVVLHRDVHSRFQGLPVPRQQLTGTSAPSMGRKDRRRLRGSPPASAGHAPRVERPVPQPISTAEGGTGAGARPQPTGHVGPLPMAQEDPLSDIVRHSCHLLQEARFNCHLFFNCIFFKILFIYS